MLVLDMNAYTPDFMAEESMVWLNENHGGSKGHAPVRPKNFSISYSFWKILAKSNVGTPWRFGALSYGESWIRPCFVHSRKLYIHCRKMKIKLWENLEHNL